MSKSFLSIGLLVSSAALLTPRIALSEEKASMSAEINPQGQPAKTTKVPAAKPAKVRTASGLEYIDTVVGTGESPKTGQRVTVHYTGTLKDGKKFDSSVDRGQPFTFVIGVGQVIKGWDEGVSTMKVGGKRTLIIPSALGYGERGAGNVIPPNSELHFDVELLGIK
jgi:peptidylprolyl isomerase